MSEANGTRDITKTVGVRDTPILVDVEDEQGLKIGDYALALARFIEQTETPMTIGIQGDWGSGKTSLMNLIEQRLGQAYPVVKVNTWKYAQTEPGQGLAIAIFLAIIRSLTKQTGGEAKQVVQRIGKALLSLGGKVAEAQLGVNVTSALAKGELDQVFEQYESLEKLKEQLEDLVGTVIKDKGTGRDRVVVFVDDLDRVQPDRAVEILEVLKVFLDIRGLVFVLACDYEVIMQGLRAKAGLGGEQVAGRSFFDKIIQVPFQMPAHTQEKLERYIEGLFRRISVESLTPETITAMVEVLRWTTGTNPRTIKRLVNILNLLLLILDSDKHTWDDKVEHKAAIVFTLVALQNAFPEAYAHLSNRDPERLFADFTTEGMQEDPGLKRLLEKKPDLSPDQLNAVLSMLKGLVGGDAGLCSRFLRVSDMAIVQSKSEIPESGSGPKRHAKSYIESQTPEAQQVIRKILAGLPDTIEYHRSTRDGETFIYFHPSATKDFTVTIWSRRRAKRVEIGFTATAKETIPGTHGETYVARMRASGCPNVMDRAPKWDNDIVSCVPYGAPDVEVEAVQRFVRWFVLEAPTLS